MGLPQKSTAPCAHVEPALHALADGELPVDDGGAAVSALRGHVARCPTCRSRWEGIVRLRRLLAAANQAAPPLPAELRQVLDAVG